MAHTYKNIKGTIRDMKRNYILFEGFANYIRISKLRKAKLFLIEYGPDVDYSKDIIKDLGIDEYVVWVPKLCRKEILLLLEQVDLGGSEFGGGFWGSWLGIFSYGSSIYA